VAALRLVVLQGQVVQVVTAAQGQAVPSPGRRLLAPVALVARAARRVVQAVLVAVVTAARQHQQTAQQGQ